MFSSKQIIPATVLLAFIAALPAYIEFIEKSGSLIYRGDLFKDYYIGFITAIVLGGLIILWPISAEYKVPLINIWIIKVFIVLGAMLIYEHKYGAGGGLDSFSYFLVSRVNEFSVGGFIHGAGTQNIKNLARFYQLYMPDSYHAMKVTWAYIGLIAVFLIFVAAKKVYAEADYKLLYLLGLFPSILFWSSILGKDPIVLFGMSLYILGVIGFYVERNVFYLLLICLGIYITSFIRIWYAPILAIPLTILLISMPLSLPYRIVIIGMLAYGIGLSLEIFSESFNIGSLAQLVATSDRISQSWAGDGGSGLAIEGGIGSVSSTLGFMPLGMFTALFRPLPGEVLNIFGLLASLENLAVIWMLILSIRRTRLRELAHPILLWAVVLVLVWAAFYSVASYQNMGSAARFKLQIVPVLLLLLLYLSRLREHDVNDENESHVE